jgi:hypothetical protein
MSEENQATVEESTEQAEQTPSADVRKTPAFQAVTQQLTEERKAKQALADRLASLEEIEAERGRSKAKEAGEFEKVEAELKSQIEALKMERTQIMEQQTKQQTDNKLQIELAMMGVNDPEHISFLSTKYHNSGENANISEWAKNISENDSYSVFFRGTKTVLTPPSGTSASVSKGVDYAQAKIDLHGRDKAKADAASKVLEAYVREHGKMPD